MTHIAIELDDTLAETLDEACKAEHVAPERFVLEAVKRRLAAQWLKRTQDSLGPAARAAGYKSEEDLMNDIS
ncbi:MAG TPA: hypothetical protein VG537_09725 [Candidatus Kapabacteria bacterium]|jgi:predicted transcriptional regulator|nr:hypothetical protein [Candidatus Kapabacteria bacterium]